MNNAEGNRLPESGGAGRIASAYFIAQFREARADLPNRHQTKRRVRDEPREQRLALPEGDRTDLDDELVRQAGVEELTGKVSTAYDPDVLRARRSAHFSVHGPHITLDEARVRAPR